MQTQKTFQRCDKIHILISDNYDYLTIYKVEAVISYLKSIII